MVTPARFILIDDSDADNVFHEIMIRRAGFTGEVRIFDNGVDALKFLRDDPLSQPTCIFLDINMPVLDGFEVAQQATRLLEGKPATVLLMLTSSDAPQDRQRAAELPVIQGYVTKPLTADMVRRMLGSHA
ncbi:MAG: response regulator [Hydrogenophaga sp.]|uniref:response regulator n=1 Tax=Hydrogenophaga sp. TaxID=1904254 RepID=UPI001694FF3F|nr:response regulator [Hydrogenophaga sp.]NIM43533.1 response regulator [Hydrogenophaga sp.]NIN28602.1 response regulator [Hydrogenophaga sp.]NIN33061.1 response regulator [Hydrogenophaga sp.]NIN57736.1 response regulator [Hydrogenophaga sp.]NIO54031.1 response regulator [Hydrogenophaga sp.]